MFSDAFFSITYNIIAGTMVYVSIVWAKELKIFFQKRFRAKNFFIKLNKEIENGFEKLDNVKVFGLKARPTFYKRKINDKVTPLFNKLYENREHYTLFEFKGLLIPPCDDGHGATVPANNEIWVNYFKTIDEKAGEKSNEGKGSDRYCRLVIFDKYILNTYCFDIKRLHILLEKRSLISVARSDDEISLKSYARYIDIYVNSIMSVHETLMLYSKNIKTYYIDKSIFISNDYLDFGMYSINGKRFLYSPMYEKGRQKRMKFEQVVIENFNHQKEKINEYDKNFNRYFNIAKSTAHSSVLKDDDFANFYSYFFENNASDIIQSDKGSGKMSFFEHDVYTLESFDSTYIKLINKIKKCLNSLLHEDDDPIENFVTYEKIRSQMSNTKDLSLKLFKTFNEVNKIHADEFKSKNKIQIYNFDVGWSLLLEHYKFSDALSTHCDFTLSSHGTKSFGTYNFDEYPALLKVFLGQKQVKIKVLIFCDISVVEAKLFFAEIKKISEYYLRFIKNFKFHNKFGPDLVAAWRAKDIQDDDFMILCTNKWIVSRVLKDQNLSSTVFKHPFNVYDSFAISQSIVYEYSKNHSPIAHLIIDINQNSIDEYKKVFNLLWKASLQENKKIIEETYKYYQSEKPGESIENEMEVFEMFIKRFHGIV